MHCVGLWRIVLCCIVANSRSTNASTGASVYTPCVVREAPRCTSSLNTACMSSHPCFHEIRCQPLWHKRLRLKLGCCLRGVCSPSRGRRPAALLTAHRCTNQTSSLCLQVAIGMRCPRASIPRVWRCYPRNRTSSTCLRTFPWMGWPWKS